MRTSIASALVLAALGFGLTAPAGATARVNTNDETYRTTVHFGDLDLKTRQGADALYSRLDLAATRVCEDATDTYLRLTRTYKKCRREALSDAVREINSPLVRQAYEQRAPRYAGEAAHHPSNRAPHA